MAKKTDIRLRRSDTAGKIPTSSNLSDGELALNTNSGALYFKKSNNEIVTVHDNTILHIDSDTTGSNTTGSSPKVGIGTTSPSSNLEVAGSAAVLKITDTRNQSFTVGDVISTLAFDSDDASGGAGSATHPRATISSITENTFGSSTGLAFSTKGDTSDAPVERIRINSVGKVGIGTTAPDKLLVVQGEGAEIAINDTDTTDTPRLRFRESGTTSGGISTNRTFIYSPFRSKNKITRYRWYTTGWNYFSSWIPVSITIKRW